MEPLLASFGPVFADDPTVQFPLQAARRNLGKFEAADKWYSEFVARQPDGPWRDAAAAELWLARRSGRRPRRRPTAATRKSGPYLDGKLDDACWQSAAPLPLRDAVGTTTADYKTEVAHRLRPRLPLRRGSLHAPGRPARSRWPGRGRTTPT